MSKYSGITEHNKAAFDAIVPKVNEGIDNNEFPKITRLLNTIWFQSIPMPGLVKKTLTISDSGYSYIQGNVPNAFFVNYNIVFIMITLNNSISFLLPVDAALGVMNLPYEDEGATTVVRVRLEISEGQSNKTLTFKFSYEPTLTTMPKVTAYAIIQRIPS